MSWETSFPEPLQWNGDKEDGPPSGFGPQREPPVFCDACGGDCHIGAVYLPFGTYCSRECGDAEQAKFDERMKRRGFMEAQPEIPFENPFGD